MAEGPIADVCSSAVDFFDLAPLLELILQLTPDPRAATMLAATCRQLRAAIVEVVRAAEEALFRRLRLSPDDLRALNEADWAAVHLSAHDAIHIARWLQPAGILHGLRWLRLAHDAPQLMDLKELRGVESPQSTKLQHLSLGARGRTRPVPPCSLLNLDRLDLRDASIVAVASLIASNTFMRELSLKFNDLGPMAARALSEALQPNVTLLELNLSFNQLGDDGASEIARLLRGNRTLLALYLIDNSIGNKGGTLVAEALQVNTTLRELSLERNYVSDAGADALAAALVASRGRSLDLVNLQFNSCSDAAKERLRAAAQQATSKQGLKALLLGRAGRGLVVV